MDALRLRLRDTLARTLANRGVTPPTLYVAEECMDRMWPMIEAALAEASNSASPISDTQIGDLSGRRHDR